MRSILLRCVGLSQNYRNFPYFYFGYIYLFYICTAKTEDYSEISKGEYFFFSKVTSSYFFLHMLAEFLYSRYLLF